MLSPDRDTDERLQHERAPPQSLWLVASNAYGIASVAKNLVPLLALYTVAPYLADRSWPLAVALAPLIGLALYRLTMVMHDCGHATLFSSRRTNERVGKLLGFVTGVDFRRFKTLHWEHHKIYGQPGDPQGFHYLGLSRMTRAAFAWHVVKPLLGANLRYAFRESIVHPRNLATAAANGELAVLVLVQAGLALLITGLGRHPWLALLPLASAATFGLFLSQLRGIAEHGVGEPGQAETHVRSHAREPFGSLLLYDVHFNFHEEHHRYPGVPSCHLPELARDLSGLPSRNIWRTLRTRGR
ncbi:MAG TPA: fatty acid desaturase [Gammaproteobacteria bacterium]|nr:fatty acid desaturase [Gammaproteobacteria bacterium]